MQEKKTVVKKKRKLKFISVLVFLIIVLLIGFSVVTVLSIPTKNIFIHGNNILTDKEIIELASLSDYPDFFSTSTNKMKRNLENDPLIKKATIKRKFFGVFDITINEAKPLFIKENTNTLVLDNMEEVSNDNKYVVPRVVNYIPDTVYDDFVKRMSLLDADIIDKISEVQYDPSKYDDSRFLFYMVDGNYVYIMLLKLDALNYYNDAYQTFEGKKGVWYLDSGGHFQIFKEE
jgi:Cell division septal protein